MTNQPQPQPEMFVFVAASGEKEKGGPGVVWVDMEKGFCRYMLLHELSSNSLRSGLEEMIENDGGHNYFIVHKSESNAHVFKYPRAEAARQFFGGSMQRMDSSTAMDKNLLH